MKMARRGRGLKDLLRGEGYSVRLTKLSPHEFDIPQIRQRIYIVGSRSSLGKFQWPEKSKTKVSIDSVLDSCPEEARQLPEQVDQCLDVWQEFLDLVPKGEKIPHPLWSMEFGATYCYEGTTGFHYSRLAPGDGDGPQWRTIQDIWFVTIGQSYNRRVTRPAENEHSLFPFAETLTLGGNP